MPGFDLLEEEPVLNIMREQDAWNAARQMGQQPQQVGAVQQDQIKFLLLNGLRDGVQETPRVRKSNLGR